MWEIYAGMVLEVAYGQVKGWQSIFFFHASLYLYMHKSAAMCSGLYNSLTFSFWVYSFRCCKKHISSFVTWVLSQTYCVKERRGNRKESLSGEYWPKWQYTVKCISDCIHLCLLRHCLPQKGWEGGDGLDCNLRLRPSQNNSCNNFAFPLRSVVMNTLRHTDTNRRICAHTKTVRWDLGLKKTGFRAEVAGIKVTSQQMLFRCNVLTPILVYLPILPSHLPSSTFSTMCVWWMGCSIIWVILI